MGRVRTAWTKVRVLRRAAREGRAQQAAVDRDHGPGDVGGALGAEEGDEVPVLLGQAEAGGGDFGPRRLFGASSEPSASASRSVAKRPVATVLTVIPSPATSRDSVFRKPTAAIRWELERLRPGIGSRVELEPTLTIRPQPRSRIPGRPRRRGPAAPAPASGRPAPTPRARGRGRRRTAGRRCWRRGSRSGRAPPRPRPAARRAGRGRRRRRRTAVARARSPPPPPRAAPRERLAIATRAPSRASAAAIPRPIPWLAPSPAPRAPPAQSMPEPILGQRSNPLRG